MKNGNKIQKKSEKNRDGLVMMLGGHCFQGPMCISKYGNICISGWKTLQLLLVKDSKKLETATKFIDILQQSNIDYKVYQ